MDMEHIKRLLLMSFTDRRILMLTIATYIEMW